MDFGDDVLSDGSNDSFFDEPKPAAKRSSLTKTPEKKSLTDIFNISESKRSDDWLGLDSTETKSPAKTPKSLSKKISFEDDDDILGNLGLSKRPSSRSEAPAEEPKKKLDLLESILGPSKPQEEKKSSLGDILKESKARIVASPTVTPNSAIADPLLSSDVPRESRRRRRSSGGLMDPLGLFTDTKQEETVEVEEKKKVEPKAIQSKSVPNVSEQGLPDWLGGTPVKQSKSENILSKPEEPEKIAPQVENEESQALNSLLTQQKLTHSNLEFQNTAIALQQQESQLLMALQLKKYEENLSDMQMKQQEVLMKQEKQFNQLLERQFAKQQVMENNMRLQQERINNHIQMLIAQPPVAQQSGREELEEVKKTVSEESVQMYENMISSLKQRQHEEVFLLEESYKKQISLLEQSLEVVEKRLKIDVEKMSEAFEEKLQSLKQQHDEEISKYKLKMQDIEAQHIEEIKQIRENNSRIIEEIKYEHSTLLENIKEAKRSESTLFQESSTYLEKLNTNIDVLYANSKSILELKDHVAKDYGVLAKAREESLKAKEEEIIMMRTTLEKCREAAETERAQLLTLVRALETKISEQNQNAREERWAFQQAASTLTARSAAMDREAEFNRTSIEREREQLKTLKETVLAEQEKMMLQLTEEKLALSAERARLETSTKLINNYDSQKAKAEIEAAVQIAKEAAEMTDRERESLHREKCEVEKLKRSLRDQERKLTMREADLENLIREAEMKKNDGEKAIFESKTIEKKYNERLRDLQNQLGTLTLRERKLAEEKIALSRERLALNTMIKQNKNKCGLCSVDPQKEETNFNIEAVNFVAPYFPRYDAVDRDIIRLRMEAIDDSSLKIEDNLPTD